MRNFEFQSGMYCPIYYTNTNKIPNNFTSARKGVTYYVTIATVIFSYVKVCSRLGIFLQNWAKFE